MTPTPATPRPTHAMTYCEPCDECEAKVNAHDALLAALRALVEACEGENTAWRGGPMRHTPVLDAMIAGRRVLINLSPEEEGQ